MAELLKQPIILWEETSRSRKTANRFLDSAGIGEEQLHVVARINDQEAVKNLVAGGLGISQISPFRTPAASIWPTGGNTSFRPI